MFLYIGKFVISKLIIIILSNKKYNSNTNRGYIEEYDCYKFNNGDDDLYHSTTIYRNYVIPFVIIETHTQLPNIKYILLISSFHILIITTSILL